MMVAPGVPRFTLEELADSSGVSKRTIRYYISEGAISQAHGRGRSSYYTPAHLRELEQVKNLRDSGLALSEIREQRIAVEPQPMSGVRWERFSPHPALEIHLRSDAPPYVRGLAERFIQDAEAWLGTTDQGDLELDESVQFVR